jgi:hypothetical protein
MSNSFQDFKNRIKSKEIKQLWERHPGLKSKFFNFFYKELLEYENPKILEFGVRHGVSTSLFLDIYNSNQDKFDIHFNFCDTGTVKIIKRNKELLNESKRIHSRENTLKNYLRKLYIKYKN